MSVTGLVVLVVWFPGLLVVDKIFYLPHLIPRLSALTESTQLKAVFTGMTDKISKVVLIEDGKNINEELSDKGIVMIFRRWYPYVNI
jgi:hypothetical protein